MCASGSYFFGMGCMDIIDLQTEGLDNPIGIDTDIPRFSWKIRGEDSFQSWYRILVASSVQQLMEGRGDLWDSGRVHSAKTYGIQYAGEPLRSKAVYYWLVETNIGKSNIATFETAYLEKAMTNAIWIGMPLAFHGATDVVRLDFNIEKDVKRARFYFAALGCCPCFLNGALVDDSYFDGAISVYHRRVFYRTLPLSVLKGKNSLCVELGYGFYGAKKMIGEVFVEYGDGTAYSIPTIAGRVWNVTRGQVIQNSLYGGEVLDARIELQQILSEEVKTDRFVAAYAVDPPAGELRANRIPPMRIVDHWAPLKVENSEDGCLLIDAGKNITGWLRIRVQGERGARVTMEYAEVLDKAGNINRANLRTAESRDTYILAGCGEETYAPAFTYHGFRYVRISIQGQAQVVGIDVEHLRTAVPPSGTFSCSESILNELHKIACQTEANNLNGVFADCPQRDERLGWLNDLSSRIFEAVCNFDLHNFLPNFVDMITDSQNKNGAIGDTVPFTVGSSIADGIDAYQLLGWIAYKFYGDVQVLQRNYDGFCRWYRFLSRFKKKGVVEWGLYGDWCPAYEYSKGGDGTHSALVTLEFMSSAYAVWNAAILAEIAKALGKTSEAEGWQTERERGKKAFFRKYLKKDGVIGNGSQTECAVAMTVFPEERDLCKTWASIAAKDIQEKGYHMTCGNQGYRHLFYRLAEYGYAKDLVKLLCNEEYPGWGFMLRNGATTVWERWEFNVYSDMHSFNHPMFAAYDGFFYNYLAGIRMGECSDAFGEIIIEPCFVDNISNVKAEFETVRGGISVNWRKEGIKYYLQVKTPGNTHLTVRARGKKLNCRGQERFGEMKLGNGEFEIEIEEIYDNDQKINGFDSCIAADGERGGVYAKG